MVKSGGQFVDSQATVVGAWKGRYAWASAAQFLPQCSAATLIIKCAEYADGCRIERAAYWYPYCLDWGTGRGVEPTASWLVLAHLLALQAHVKSSLMGASLMLPISHGRFGMGTWQDHAQARAGAQPIFVGNVICGMQFAGITAAQEGS
eukprot:1145992-Pelagomonas_calceolata.AAC.1